jgi:hypothetical protein
MQGTPKILSSSGASNPTKKPNFLTSQEKTIAAAANRVGNPSRKKHLNPIQNLVEIPDGGQDAEQELKNPAKEGQEKGAGEHLPFQIHAEKGKEEEKRSEEKKSRRAGGH